ncbi:MAG: hypothetical protein ABI120_16655, partial [Gemmatimonadaceae bacterium]
RWLAPFRVRDFMWGGFDGRLREVLDRSPTHCLWTFRTGPDSLDGPRAGWTPVPYTTRLRLLDRLTF